MRIRARARGDGDGEGDDDDGLICLGPDEEEGSRREALRNTEWSSPCKRPSLVASPLSAGETSRKDWSVSHNSQSYPPAASLLSGPILRRPPAGAPASWL